MAPTTPLESYPTIEPEITFQLGSASKRLSKSRRVVTALEHSSDAADVVDSSDGTTRLKTVLGVSNPVPPSTHNAPAAGKSIDTHADGATKKPIDLVVRVISRPSAGRELPFVKEELSLGGVAVAALKRHGDDVWLLLVEGAETPRHNGAPIPSQGTALVPGDKFEVAGTELTLSKR